MNIRSSILSVEGSRKRPTKAFFEGMQAFNILTVLIQSATLRIEAEESYQKLLLKSVHKLNQISFLSDPSSAPIQPYSQTLHHYRTLGTERIFQVRKFRNQVIKEVNQLKQSVQQVKHQFQNQLDSVKVMERTINENLDRLLAQRRKLQQYLQESDEKLVLSQLSMLQKQPQSQAHNNLQLSIDLLFSDQNQKCQQFDQKTAKFKADVRKYEQDLALKHQDICKLNKKAVELFVGYLKKINVEEISLVRNIQYDIDRMIKMANLFDQQQYEEVEEDGEEKGKGKDKDQKRGFGDRLSQDVNRDESLLLPQTMSIPDTTRLQSAECLDVFKKFKRRNFHFNQQNSSLRIGQEQPLQCKDGNKGASLPKKIKHHTSSQFQRFKASLQEPEEYKELLKSMKSSDWEHENYEQLSVEFVQNYHKSSTFKFKPDAFKHLTKVLTRILRLAYQNNSFVLISRVVMYSRFYAIADEEDSRFKRNPKTVFDRIKTESFMSDLKFWKFFLLHEITCAVESVTQNDQLLCKENPDQDCDYERKQLLSNVVYSTLLSNSLIMTSCGIDKYEIKNMLTKISKGFGGLSEKQTHDLMHFVEGGYLTVRNIKKSERKLRKCQKEKQKQREPVDTNNHQNRSVHDQDQ